MKKFLFGLMACVTLLAASCENNTSEDDTLYEKGIDRNKVEKGNRK